MLHMYIFADTPLYHMLYLEYKFALPHTRTHACTYKFISIFSFLLFHLFSFALVFFYLVSMLQVHCFRSCGTFSIAPHKWLATATRARILVILFVCVLVVELSNGWEVFACLSNCYRLLGSQLAYRQLGGNCWWFCAAIVQCFAARCAKNSANYTFFKAVLKLIENIRN